jgi:VanZ family protein
MGNKFINRLVLAAAVMYAVLIFTLSSFPGDFFPPAPFISFDKLAHTGEFGVLAMLVYNSLRYSTSSKHPYLLTLTVCILYAATDEVHQMFVPGRFSDIRDFAADTIGIIFFGGISAILNPLKERISKDPKTSDYRS